LGGGVRTGVIRSDDPPRPDEAKEESILCHTKRFLSQALNHFSYVLAKITLCGNAYKKERKTEGKDRRNHFSKGKAKQGTQCLGTISYRVSTSFFLSR
jgi:hypothetical protein